MNLIKNLTLLSASLFILSSCKKDAVIPKSTIVQDENKSNFAVADTCTAPVIAWDKQTTNTYNTYAVATSVTTGNTGTIYVAGLYRGAVDINPGAGVFNLSGKGAYVQVLNPDGSFKTGRQIPFDNQFQTLLYKTNDDPGYTDINVDAAENVYLTAFEPYWNGTSNNTINLVKVNKTGSLIYWVKFNNSTHNKIRSVVDAAGNIITAGSYNSDPAVGGVVDLNPGTGVFNTPASGKGVFIQKLDANGNFISAKTSTDFVLINDMQIDPAGKLYISGKTGGKVISDVFLVINSSWTSVTTHQLTIYGGTYNISFDDNNYLYINAKGLGKFVAVNQPVWGVPTLSNLQTYTSDHLGNFYQASGTAYGQIVKFNVNGQEVWRKPIPGLIYAPELMLMTRDHQNNIILVVNNSVSDSRPTRIIKYKACQ